MSLLPPDDDWLIEEPPDDLFDTFEEEPPARDFEDATPPEPPDFPPMADEPEPYAPPIPSAQDYVVPEELYADEPLELPAEVYPTQTTAPASETLVIERVSTWRLQQCGVLIEEVFADAPDPDHYAVGIMEVWHDPQTSDQKGAYLHMADAPYLERAGEMRDNIYRMADEAGVSDPDLGNFAHGLIQQRGEWQPLTGAQWEVVDNTPDFHDEATWGARDQLLAQAVEISGAELAREEIDQSHELQTVMRGVGLQSEDFNPVNTPPPLFDESTNTAYWIGVYQPDPNNSHEAITSILSIQQDDTGQPIAHLAPVATGDWDHAYRTAEYLLGVAERTQDVGQVLDTAEAMAVATQKRELWDSDQGIILKENIAFSTPELG